MYEEDYKAFFYHKLEIFQACLAITVAIRGTSKEKPYQELDFRFGVASASKLVHKTITFLQGF